MTVNESDEGNFGGGPDPSGKPTDEILDKEIPINCPIICDTCLHCRPIDIEYHNELTGKERAGCYVKVPIEPAWYSTFKPPVNPEDPGCSEWHLHSAKTTFTERRAAIRKERYLKKYDLDYQMELAEEDRKRNQDNEIFRKEGR